ncbi:hypothetical protein FSO04_18860 [Paraburkholderia madseniana]|uniref:Uncharacterized protein n=1 Tax=Paraburkholderia madseniana TaxID=2599607 RepID=A0A6N6WCS2_9BURK|nr:hypothetical protein [Paraburkholderia madseniana]KAE8758447.1 hypothetical protein FSO04_18860 [Paraburkholderia madseniana]
MERHFMSRGGAVAYLVASTKHLGREHKEAGPGGKHREIQRRIDALEQLILDVRAGRVHALKTPTAEIVIMD